jgi:transcription antitermination factor NusG
MAAESSASAPKWSVGPKMSAAFVATASVSLAPDPPQEDSRPVAPVAGRWFVLHTLSRQEKAAALVAEAAGGKCFLPTVRRVTYYAHRRRVVESPLFASYVFLWGAVEHAYAAVQLKRVAQVLPVHDQDQFEHEIRQVRLATEGCAELSPYRMFSCGRYVRVTAGPLEGLEGVVEDAKRPTRLVLKVHAVGRALSLEIDASLLELLD